MKSDRINLVAPASAVHRARYRTGKVDPARKFKCTTAAREESGIYISLKIA